MSADEKLDLSQLLFADVGWKDLIAFAWDIHSIYGLAAVYEYLTSSDGKNKLIENDFKIFDDVKAVKKVQAGPGTLLISFNVGLVRNPDGGY